MGMRGLIICLTSVALLALGAGPAAAATKTASGGGVTATLTYKASSGGHVSSPALSISGGPAPYSAPVKLQVCDGGPYCLFGSLAVKDLNGDGNNDVVLDLFSGGAHCCDWVQVYYPAGGAYDVATRNFGDPGFELKDLSHNGHAEFVTADDSFAYTFSSYAESGLPLQILTFADGRFDDVTTRYPALIAKDAAAWWKYYGQDHTSGRNGLIAAWAADEYNLGRAAHARAVLGRQVKARHITAGFVRRLEAFLKRHGY